MLAIETVHAGHFPDDSDVIQHLEMFEQLRNQRKTITNLTEIIQTTNLLPKSSPLFWIAISMRLGSWASAITFCCVKLWLVRKANIGPQVFYEVGPSSKVGSSYVDLRRTGRH